MVGYSMVVEFVKGLVARLSEEREGQGMVEYGLIIALIAVVVVVALGPLGTAVAQIFTDITASL